MLTLVLGHGRQKMESDVDELTRVISVDADGDDCPGLSHRDELLLDLLKGALVDPSELKEAEAEYARIKHQRSQGTYVAPSKMTVEELVDAWLVEATKDVEVATKRSYEDAMRYVRAHLGKKPVQELTEDDVDALITWMLTEARRIGGKPGTGLSVRTADLTLGACAPCSNSGSGVRSSPGTSPST
ncbi:hypothetical protein ACIG53_20855 [Streptomyces bauhiniae]|uniref:hypothetical protein n=1 Tax=Streptomyces bauhiniae TaxID=2340725 RepID=UPI0037D32C83